MPEVYENYLQLQSGFPENQDYFPYGHELLSVSSSSSSTFSPYSGSSNSQGTASVASPMSTSLSPLHGSDYLTLNNATLIGEAHITILEQPMEKFRFRYKSEMIGTHGSLVGASSASSRKKHAPTVQLHNFPEKAVIRCTLVTSEEGQRIPHAHRLIRKDGSGDCDDPHHIEVSSNTGFIAAFHGMGIIHTAKKYIRDELIRKMRVEALEKVKRRNINATLSTLEEAQIKADAECFQKYVNLNSVALCFQAFILDQNDVLTPVTDPVYSNPINNLKSALTGELKICRIDKYTGTCEGGEEVFILVEKVGKKNIRVKFYELNDNDQEVWSAQGTFTELDVHHQYAIVFRTPPYRNLNITSPKEVFIQLERPTDGDCSEPVKFTYKPSDRIIGRKRPRMSCSDSADLSEAIAGCFNALSAESPVVLNNESREYSTEINKMLSDRCSSTDFVDYIAQIDVDKYAQFFESNEENMLTYDGPPSQQYQDDRMFARNVFIEADRCMKRDPKSIKTRLQKLLKDRSTYGDSPLHAALRYGQRNIVRYILMLISTDKDCEALVNGQNSSGKTPLHYAVLTNQPEITKVLIILGADPNRVDDHGFSPLHAAARLCDAGACVVALVSKRSINVEAHTDAGWTPLQLAAEAGSYDAFRSLVHAGANVNNTDMSYGRTALHLAVEAGHKDIVEFLLKETDIEVNKKNFSGNTALHSAVVHSGPRAKELCALLIQHGANPRIQNHNREPEEDDGIKVPQPSGIRMETELEDEGGEASTGQSSFDLAFNNPIILQLLNAPTSDPEVTASEEVSNRESESEDLRRDWMNSECKENLAGILDKTQGWKKLAKYLHVEYLLRTLEQSTVSPSRLLLNYIDIQTTISLPEIRDILKAVEEDDAVEYVTSVLTTQPQDISSTT